VLLREATLILVYDVLWKRLLIIDIFNYRISNCENELRFTCMQVFTVNLLVFKSVHIPICLPIHPFDLSVCLQVLSLCIHPFNLSVYLSACLSVSLTSLYVCLFIHTIRLSKNCPSLCLFVVCLSHYSSLCLSISVRVCPSICLSFSMCLCLYIH